MSRSERIVPFVVLLAAARAVIAFGDLYRPSLQLPLHLLEERSVEGRLLWGEKIPLCVADEGDLSLLDDLNRRTLRELLIDREQVLSAAEKLPPKKQYRALLLVRGIGEKTAKKLDRVLSLERHTPLAVLTSRSSAHPPPYHPSFRP